MMRISGLAIVFSFIFISLFLELLFCVTHVTVVFGIYYCSFFAFTKRKNENKTKCGKLKAFNQLDSLFVSINRLKKSFSSSSFCKQFVLTLKCQRLNWNHEDSVLVVLKCHRLVLTMLDRAKLALVRRVAATVSTSCLIHFLPFPKVSLLLKYLSAKIGIK